jgi:hypothetical protein
MGREHLGTDIAMTEEFLDGPDIVAVFQRVGPAEKKGSSPRFCLRRAGYARE